MRRVSVIIAASLVLIGCAASAPKLDHPTFLNSLEVPLRTVTVDGQVYPTSPLVGDIKPGAWYLVGNPFPLDVDDNGTPDHLAYPLTDGDRMVLTIDNEEGQPVFYAVYSSEGKVLEWAGNRGAVIRSTSAVTPPMNRGLSI
jgi:hypothetical protein